MKVIMKYNNYSCFSYEVCAPSVLKRMRSDFEPKGCFLSKLKSRMLRSVYRSGKSRDQL